MLNKSGPSTDPWSTPKGNFAQILATNFNAHYCSSIVQSVEYSSISSYKSEAIKN